MFTQDLTCWEIASVLGHTVYSFVVCSMSNRVRLCNCSRDVHTRLDIWLVLELAGDPPLRVKRLPIVSCGTEYPLGEMVLKNIHAQYSTMQMGKNETGKWY